MTDNNTPKKRAINITAKIGTAFIFIGILSILITAFSSYFLYSKVLEKSALGRIDSIRVMLQRQVDDQLDKWSTASLSLAAPADAAIREASLPQAATSFFEQNDAGSSDKNQKHLAESVQRQGFSDAYLYNSRGLLVKNVLAEGINPPNAVNEIVLGIAAREPPSPAVKFRYNGDEDPQNLVFVYVVPIPIGENYITGFLVVEREPLSVFRMLNFGGRPSDAGLGRTGQAYLLDENLTPKSPVRKLSGNTPVRSEGVSNALTGAVGSSAYNDYQNTSVFGSYGKLKTEGLDWAIIVEQSSAEALSPARSVTLYIAMIGIGLVILVGVVGVAFAKSFSKPILALEATMQKIRSGDDSARAEVLSNDEIGKLAASFNEMVDERNSEKNQVSSDSRRLQNNIQDLLLVVADASEGTLSVRAKKTEGVLGNIADALNQMLQNVGNLIGEAKRVSGEVTQASTGITSDAQGLTEGATLQTSQVNTTIQDVQNLAEESQNVSENSKEAAASATRTREAAETGANSIRDAINFMQRLNESVQETAKKIDSLGERSKEISGIVQSISEISAETDVLAMNASIEAARAGEHGKGFTIVADQVRALADRTQLATVEIEVLVRDIQTETQDAVKTMESQTREVENGTKQVSSAGDALGNIVDVSVDSSTLAEQISSSAAEQERRAEAVLASVRSINKIAEETRDKTVDFQKTSDQLAQLANELNSQLANFEIDREE
ncbi:MAG: methyl-accepting chemotaxis protein [Verrucomicrobiota bacterium]